MELSTVLLGCLVVTGACVAGALLRRRRRAHFSGQASESVAAFSEPAAQDHPLEAHAPCEVRLFARLEAPEPALEVGGQEDEPVQELAGDEELSAEEIVSAEEGHEPFLEQEIVLEDIQALETESLAQAPIAEELVAEEPVAVFPASSPRLILPPAIPAELDERFSDLHERMDALESFMNELESTLAAIEPEEEAPRKAA